MKYKVLYQYTDITPEGDDITRQATRYFTRNQDYQDFIQSVRLSPDDSIIAEQSKPAIICGLWYALAFIVYICQGYRIRAGRSLFYICIGKSFTRAINDPLCYKFDNAGYQYINFNL